MNDTPTNGVPADAPLDADLLAGLFDLAELGLLASRPDDAVQVHSRNTHGTAGGFFLHSEENTDLCAACRAFLQELLTDGLARELANPASLDTADGEQIGPPVGADLAAIRGRTVTIAPHQQVEPQHLRLHGGLVVHRYTEPAGRGRVRTEIPCCPRTPTTLGRALALPTDLTGTRLGSQFGLSTSQHIAPDLTLAVCPQCSLGWDVNLVNEGDGGFQATFALIGPVLVAAARRTYKSM